MDLRGVREGIEMQTNAPECVRMQMHEYAYECVRIRRDAHCGAEVAQKRDRSGAEWYAYECVRMRTVSNASECVECI